MNTLVRFVTLIGMLSLLFGACGGSSTSDGAPVHDMSVAADASTTVDMNTSGIAACLMQCAAGNAASYKINQGYLLAQCGCGNDGAVCASKCTAECAAPGTLATGSPCGACLAAEEVKGVNSVCDEHAATLCINDANCSPYNMCSGLCYH